MCSGMVGSSCSTCNTRRVKICVQSRNNEIVLVGFVLLELTLIS
jgi:hypothetical protein